MRYIIAPVEEKVVHYYNVILGKIPCGARSDSSEKNFTVFPERVNCASCLSMAGARMNAAFREQGERSAA